MTVPLILASNAIIFALILLLSLPHSSHAVFTKVEETFLSVPDAQSARENLHFITSEPHVAGTSGDLIMGEFVLEEFQKAGIPNVEMFHLDVMLNYPRTPASLSIVSPNDTSHVLYTASLSEDIMNFDATSDTIWRNHTFHGYGASGNLSAAPMVYANYGRVEDFEALQQAGIDVNNTVVVVRYGKCFRGLKVKNAQDRGAVGVLIYSDPADDGYGVGPVYPDGPWRPACGVQRGSVQFLSMCAGDPLRLDDRYGDETFEDICGLKDRFDLLPKIPSLPISYGDAKPLLARMGGAKARDVGGDDFCGGLDIDYTVGPSSDTALVQLVVDNQEEIRTIPNVIGHIPGILPPDQDMPVLLGNHRDAWVYGAADPNSGTASLLEVARGLGKLVQTGWKPRNSIYLLSWSGEEYALLGSTGWAELMYRDSEKTNVIQRAAAYLNVDTVVSGDVLKVSATPSLTTVWKQVMTDMYDNRTHHHRVDFGNAPLGLIRDRNTKWVLNDVDNGRGRTFEQQARPDRDVGLLGSGSDFTVFVDHFGIASLDFAFHKNRSQYGQYHSIYDSFAWIDAYGGVDGQPGSSFDLMAFSAKIWGLLALRLAGDGSSNGIHGDNVVMPFDQILQGAALKDYVAAIDKQDTGLDLTALKTAVESYRKAAASLQVVCRDDGQMEAGLCNHKLVLVERQFLNSQGLPGRPWFKHVLVAPGLHTGYAAEAFPSIQQAIDDKDLVLAQDQVSIAVERVQAAALWLQPASPIIGISSQKE